MQLAANLSWMYRHLPWAGRFNAAAGDGFRGVEILLPYDEAPDWYAARLRAAGLQLVLLNTPVGEGPGALGWAAVPGQEAAFRTAFDRARAVAAATGCRAIHVMAGRTAGLPPADCADALQRNLDHALLLAEADDLVLLLEPLNLSDNPGYHYQRPAQVLSVLRAMPSPRLRLQFDCYHCVREGVALDAALLHDCAPWIGHVQLAGADGRHEPDLGRDGLLEALAALPGLGYDGWLGCEYQPRGLPAAGLGWCAPLRARGLLS
jgi:hydroxypyruvate isomerase